MERSPDPGPEGEAISLVEGRRSPKDGEVALERSPDRWDVVFVENGVKHRLWVGWTLDQWGRSPPSVQLRKGRSPRDGSEEISFWVDGEGERSPSEGEAISPAAATAMEIARQLRHVNAIAHRACLDPPLEFRRATGKGETTHMLLCAVAALEDGLEVMVSGDDADGLRQRVTAIGRATGSPTAMIRVVPHAAGLSLLQAGHFVPSSGRALFMDQPSPGQNLRPHGFAGGNAVSQAVARDRRRAIRRGASPFTTQVFESSDTPPHPTKE